MGKPIMADTRQVPPKHPLAEVFGFPTDNHSSEAQRHRRVRLCPYHNKVPNCTKDKVIDPLGVCAIYSESGEATITCPIRFREGWIITEDAASFFFPAGASWTSLTEIRLKDGNGLLAGNIDVVLVAYDERGKMLNFGSLEVQAVYISGNVRNPFYHYMQNQTTARCAPDPPESSGGTPAGHAESPPDAQVGYSRSPQVFRSTSSSARVAWGPRYRAAYRQRD
jgi:hypothetical protein